MHPNLRHRPMRICLLARADYELVRRRAEHFALRGHEVHVVSLEAGELAGCTVHLPRRTGGHGPLRYALAAPFVYRKIAAIEPDVVDAYGASSYGLYAIRPLGAPRIATIHGPDIYMVAANSPLLRLAVRALLRRAEMIHGSTSAVAGYVKEHVGLEIGSRLKVHGWGIPYGEIAADAEGRRRRIRGELQIGPRTRVIVHCRHIAAIWRPQVLLEAFAATLGRHPDSELWYVYPRPNVAGQALLERLEERVGQLGLGGRVRFLGPQPHDRFISLMHAADLFACIGENDLLASTLLEAMATGLVPVLSDLPAYREVIDDGRNGFLLPEITPEALAGRLIDLLGRFDGLQPALAEHNRRLVAESHDAAACSDWLLEQYEALVEAWRGR
jgi:glycosyltransferase involved in cell wall biosynthesis